MYLVDNVLLPKNSVYMVDGKGSLNDNFQSDLIFGPKITDHLT